MANNILLPPNADDFQQLAATIVCFDDKHAYDWNDLQQSVQQWQLQIAQVDDTAIALYHEDAFQFLAALLAVWGCNKAALIAPNSLPATHEMLAGYSNTFLGQWSSENPAITPRNTLPSDAALLMFTSGSTGEPVAVAKSFAQLNAELDMLQAQFAQSLGNSNFVSMVSHHHQYGIVFGVLWPLRQGRAFYRYRVQFFEKLIQLQKKGHLVLISSPTQLASIPGSVSFAENAGLSGVFSAGAVLSPQAWSAARQQLGVSPVEIYGSTEAGACAWRLEEDALWQTLPGVQASCAANACLRLASPALPNADVLLTSDKVVMQGGRFQLDGRLDTIVKLAGKRVSLQAVESVLCTHSLVSSVRLLPHVKRQNRLAAVVVLTDAGAAMLVDKGAGALSQQLKTAMRSTLETESIPRYWRFVRQMPLNTQGKTDRQALQRLFLDDAAPTLPDILARRERDDVLEIDFSVPLDLHYLRGHFPANPILPGVVQLTWAEQFAAEYFSLSGAFSDLEAVKFQQVIQPGVVVTLRLQWQSEKQKLLFSYSSESAKFSSGRLVFGGAA